MSQCALTRRGGNVPMCPHKGGNVPPKVPPKDGGEEGSKNVPLFLERGGGHGAYYFILKSVCIAKEITSPEALFDENVPLVKKLDSFSVSAKWSL